MKPVRMVQGTAVPLDRSDVDTDQIIPSDWLKQVERTGFEWRRAGCSMCLGMNPDILAPGERCASTSNRNFEGRQGRGGRTHLVSPAVAAATAIAGHFATPQDLRDDDLRDGALQ